MVRYLLTIGLLGLSLCQFQQAFGRCNNTKLVAANYKGCKPFEAKLEVKGLPSGASTLIWKFGKSAGVLVGDNTVEQYTYDDYGRYRPELIVLDNNDDTLCKVGLNQGRQIEVYDNPKADFEITSPNIQCIHGNEFKLRERVERGESGAPIDKYIYGYSGINGLAPKDGDTTISYNRAGTYLLPLQIADTNGCTDLIEKKMEVKKVLIADTALTTCDSLTSPLTNKTYTKTGKYADTIKNPSTCDTIVRIDLTIKPLDSSVKMVEEGLKANSKAGAYQWLDCRNNYSPVDSAVNRVFRPAKDGKYAVEVTMGNCVDTSACKTFTSTGLGNYQGNAGLTLYPVPVDDKLNISFQSEAEAISDVQVFNSLGHKLKISYEVHKRRGDKASLDFTRLKSGFYHVIIRLKTGEKLTRKILVK